MRPVSAASKRAHEPCPTQMLWAPLPLPAVAPNDVLRLASASTAPIARPAPPVVPSAISNAWACIPRRLSRGRRHERGASPLLPQSQVPVEAAGADRERAQGVLLQGLP